MKTSHSIQKIIKDNKHTHAFIKIHVITSVILVLFKHFVIVFINILNYHLFSPLRSPHAGFCSYFHVQTTTFWCQQTIKLSKNSH